MTTDRIEDIARAFDERLDISRRTAEWVAHRYLPECAAWPTLQIDDVSGIPFLTAVVGVELYQLRARVRARAGDLFAATCADMPDYERYNRQHLALGAAGFVYAAPTGPKIAVADACRHGAAFAQLVAFARAQGRLLIHPYMGIESVWELARDLSVAANVPVRVLAPPPPVTWLANDKAHVAAVVAEVLGPDWLCDTRMSAEPEYLAGHLRALARRHERVALKLTRCASAMGNAVFSAADILGEPEGATVRRVESFLAAKEWTPGDTVLVVSWEDNTDSPSSQLWLPPHGDGAPVCEGLYEQLLVGEERMFLGSIPSGLGPDVEAAMTRGSLAIAELFQRLGYVGRCSFDFIVPDGKVLCVECNGRWGGTSTPMHLVDRLFPDRRPSYRARDVVCKDLIGGTFDDLLERLGDDVYDARTGKGRFILYNVGCLPVYGKFDVIALGETPEEATKALEQDLEERLQ